MLRIQNHSHMCMLRSYISGDTDDETTCMPMLLHVIKFVGMCWPVDLSSSRYWLA